MHDRRVTLPRTMHLLCQGSLGPLKLRHDELCLGCFDFLKPAYLHPNLLFGLLSQISHLAEQLLQLNQFGVCYGPLEV